MRTTLFDEMGLPDHVEKTSAVASALFACRLQSRNNVTVAK
jgi:hypothetical protein